MVRFSPQERSSECFFGQIADRSSPHVVKHPFKVPTEHLVDVLVSQMCEDVAEEVSLDPQEYEQRQTDQRMFQFLYFCKRSSRW